LKKEKPWLLIKRKMDFSLRKKNTRKFGIATTTRHTTHERSVRNYMENLEVENGGKKEVLKKKRRTRATTHC